jgi:hypothetical protein
MKKVLSIDLDAFWSGTETIYVNMEKRRLPDFDWMLGWIYDLNFKKLVVGIDHHELCCELDGFDGPLQVINIDAHHDVYADNHFIWSLPLFYRSGRVTIGNFFFQLLREGKIMNFKWLLPDGANLESAAQEVLRHIGPHYFKRIAIESLRDLDFKIPFDLVFISISPEWIPKNELIPIKKFLEGFSLEKGYIESIKCRIQNRWECGDDNVRVNNDRFRFDHKSLI